MAEDDFRPRISSDVHNRVRLCYFDQNINFSLIYEGAVDMMFTQDGEKEEWYQRIEELADDENIEFEQALHNVIVSVVNREGKFKPGARQIYARDNSIGE